MQRRNGREDEIRTGFAASTAPVERRGAAGQLGLAPEFQHVAEHGDAAAVRGLGLDALRGDGEGGADRGRVGVVALVDRGRPRATVRPLQGGLRWPRPTGARRAASDSPAARARSAPEFRMHHRHARRGCCSSRCARPGVPSLVGHLLDAHHHRVHHGEVGAAARSAAPRDIGLNIGMSLLPEGHDPAHGRRGLGQMGRAAVE